MSSWLHPLRRGVQRVVDRYVSARAQAIPIDDTTANDVFIVGYPKSGNTWFQHLAAGLVYRMDLAFTPDSLVQELVPDVHFRRYYRRYVSPMYFKSHHLPMPGYRRVVYLVRDGRDAMMSYYHFLKQLHGRTYELSRIVRHGEGLDYGDWHEHVQKWLANPFGAEMMVIKYEDLRAQPVVEVKRFCQFAGLDCPDTVVADVIQKASFEGMQAREKKYGMEGWDSSKGLFVRKGAVGGFRNEMPPDVLESFNLKSSEVLRQFGYL